ncbi:MAG: hypothetical protein JXN63_07005 [Candidatus Delongbacteria bacterium]|nr:hypothetical protein [Candidatus Delongbacteria bacterium]
MKKILLAMLVTFSFMHAGITFTSGSRVYIGNATLGVYGNITNNLVKEGSESKLATIDFLSTSKVSFVGSSNDTITNIYTFPNIEINKPSGSVRLNNSTANFALTGTISFVSGNVVTGTNTFELASTASVTGESTSGYIVGTTKASRLVGTGSSTFGGIGYSMGTGTGNLGTVTIYRYTGDGSEVVLYGSEGIWRKWDVQTSNAFTGTRQVTTSWLSGEDNGNVLSNLKVWKYDQSKVSGSEETEPGIMKKKSTAKTAVRNAETGSERNIEDVYDGYTPVGEAPKTLGWVEVDGAVFNTTGSPRTATYTINSATQYTINDVANAFADGAGTEANPYQIATLDQLNAVRNYLSACFIQVADIDASATSTWNSGAGWIPITSFAGKYNGQGYTVSNLYINRPAQDLVGLFGSTTPAGIIENIGIENADVTGRQYAGTLVGRNEGIVRYCYSNGLLDTTDGYRSGGFAGYIFTGSSISNCYANVDVTRSAGTNTTDNGAFCGRNFGGDISNSYSTGSVSYTGSTDPINKGFVGSSTGTFSNNFWNTEVSGQSTATGASGLTSDGMRTLSNFTTATWDFQGESVNGTEDIWGINAVENNGFPFLSWQRISHNPSPFAGGIGTSDEPFLVSNLTQLNEVRSFLSYNFLQTADIDASPTSTWDSGAGWSGIYNFAGVYNGGGHIVTDLYVNRPASSYCALFGRTNGAVIYDMGVKGGNITGANYVGNLIGLAYNSTVDNCFAEGNVKGNNEVGSFVGRNSTTSVISNCYAKGSVTRATGQTATFFGGFAGANWSQINNSYSTSGVYYENTTDPTDKGFLGYNTGTTGNVFWNTETSAQSSSAGTATGLTDAEMSTLSTFTSAGWDFFGESANGTNDYWNIHSSLNDGYPYLNWEYRLPVEAPANLALTVSGTDVIITWNAVTDATGYLVYSSEDPYGTFTLDETGTFNGTEWTGPFTGTKMFYYVSAINNTKINENKIIMVREDRLR